MAEALVKTVLIMAGGTGGHVFPALATADALRARGISVQWLGTSRGIESQLVPAAGIPLHVISVTGLRGKNPLTLLKAPLQLLRALWQSLRVVRRVRPVTVLGMGGFAAGPGGVAAWILRRPLVIHEQNAVPGTTNRLLSRLARRVLQGFPVALGGDKGEHVGNPVREAIAVLPPPAERWRERGGALRLLVLGGSLGAKPINETVPAALRQMPAEARPVVRHQCGRAHVDVVTAAYRNCEVEAVVQPFIDDMAAAYQWADLVLCRAGALTVAELTAAGVGALLVPLPHAIDDHQRKNAQWFVDGGAGELMAQASMTAETLARRLQALSSQREGLLQWAQAARAMAKPDAAERVASICLEVAHV